MIDRVEIGALAALALTTLAAPEAHAQQDPRDAPSPLQIIHVQGNVFLIPGAGGNVSLQVGEDGVLIVDSGLEESAQRLLETIRQFTDRPIRGIINTHVHADHTGGNSVLAAAGQHLGYLEEGVAGAAIYAHENVLHRMSGALAESGEYPESGWPLETYFTEKLDLYINGESIQILYQPAAHTDGDSIVYFRRSDVVSTGDVFVTTSYPFIDAARGGTLQGIINALNRIIDLVIPDANEEGGTLVISGHGRIVDEYGVVTYRDMLTIIRDRIVAMIEMGMSLEQVKAARPSRDYDGRYGLDTDFWSTDRFIETIYRELADD